MIPLCRRSYGQQRRLRRRWRAPSPGSALKSLPARARRAFRAGFRSAQNDLLVFNGSPAHVSALSRPGTRPGIRPVMPATGGGTGHDAAFSRCLSAAGIRFLGILSRQGLPPLLRSAYRATSSADPDRVSVFRTHETQLGWAPSIPPGQRCSHDRCEVHGRRLPLHSGQPLSPRSRYPPRGVRVNETSSRVLIRPSSLPLTCGPGTEPAPLGFP